MQLLPRKLGAQLDSATAAGVVHLSAGGTSVILDLSGPRLPRVVHWGADPGEVSADELSAIVAAAKPPVVTNSIDEPLAPGLIAEPATGWMGTPGISGHRAGTAFSPLFTVTDYDVRSEPGGGGRVVVRAVDLAAELSLRIDVQLDSFGVLMLQAELASSAAVGSYDLQALSLTLPLPVSAQEILDFTGRHLRERSPQRHGFTVGSHVRASRRGRTGSDATLLLLAGEPGFGFRRGPVWGVHTAWSGNHLTYAERDMAGTGVIGGGELLTPGEIRLGAGETYTTPMIYAAYGDGLDDVSAKLHDHLRARPQHPRSPRLVALNTWEAVYFDHDVTKLTALADVAATIGVERFILDDGWFRHRRNDRAGLGDWYVDEQVWPDGLHPLVEHVRFHGMQFGLWFEPEMINPDSDTARAHPDWIMSTGTRNPPEARQQQVLDLANAAAYAYVLERMDSLLTEYAIDYVKWDHNRDLVDAGHPAAGVPGVHDQTLAVYALIDELRLRHPALEIESCSSGGSRADLAILSRTERIWGSDCLDALERQRIQRWTGLLLPPEMLGSHIGAPTSHSTGRTHSLDLRAGTAMFGHFGIEADLTRSTPEELQALSWWIDLHKRFRPLIHGGRVVRSDHPDPAHWLHGVVAGDGSEALFALVCMATGEWAPPGRLTFPGLADERRYAVDVLVPADRSRRHGLPAWPDWLQSPVTLSGRSLGTVGLQAPALAPEQLVLIHLDAR